MRPTTPDPDKSDPGFIPGGSDDLRWATRKKLSRQSRLAEELFEPAEVGSGIATEPRPQHAGVPTALEAGAHLAPARPIGAGQIAGVPAAQPGGQTGEEPHRAAQHRRRAVGLAAGRPPLVAAVRPEQLLEPVVG